MKLLPLAPAYGRTYASRISPDISHQSEFLHGTHAGQCDQRVRSNPNHDSTTSVTVSFKSVGLMVSGTLFPPDQQFPESPSSVNLDSSAKSTEAHCCLVQETCSLAQHKRALLCRALRDMLSHKLIFGMD
ncbi:hypothetical protein AVEN_269785-1 [Araneus ventricosus]|uniref:Uncharacterized protein n=1 Tax=Araneus ventricosus TaxID=182803 RepID=A0A4Y2V7J0_ARAVE|nr:hypothetical protein AVEN_269785-1 [Araneus ventricosus]